MLQDTGQTAQGGTPSGQKLASSLREYIDQTLKEGSISDFQRQILERSQQSGSIAVSDYESAWSGYKQCMADKGYRGIILTKYPNGLYMEAARKQGTGPQESQYLQNRQTCETAYVSAVQDVFGVQVGNPSLFSNMSEAIVDCFHRESLVPKSYTAQRFDKEQTSSSDGPRYSFDERNPKIRACMASNGYATGFPGDETEKLW